MTDCLLVVTTVASPTDGARIARSLVERKLVACAHLSEVRSFYCWDGAVQDEPEFRLQLKTTVAGYEAVAAALRAMHPYTLPAIYAVPIERIDAAYAAWVTDALATPSEPEDLR